MRARAALLLLGLMTFAQAAAAQDGGDAAAAEALYREAASDMEARNYAAACPKLEESFRLDPQTGALLTLAACYERAGKIASAWVRYLDVEARAQKAGEKDRQAVAHDKAEELSPRLPRLRIELAPGVASLAGLEVRRDQTVVGAATLATALPVDPGEHVVEVRATGRAPARKSMTAVEGRTDVVAFDALELAEGASSPPTDLPATPTAPPEREGGLGGVQVGGIVVGSLGIAAVGVGFAFGAIASSATSDLDELGTYGDDGRCPASQLDACRAKYDDASTSATLSTILVVSGGVLAGAGLVMILAGDEADAESARLEVSPSLGGAVVRGAL